MKEQFSLMLNFHWEGLKIISDFTEADNQIASTKYNVDVKWTLISDKRVLTFDQAKNTLISAGKF